jgi:glycyl-tRNA synthetase alpha chain
MTQNNINKILSFQEIILKLQNYWQDYGCAILQPFDAHVGAGTFHPATVLRSLSKKPWNVAFVQPSRRPADSRYGTHPNRLQHYYQFQVILKPSPDNMQELYLESLNQLGINVKKQDIRFVEDDWASPTLGASGLGWEIWLNGMEVSQFTYMQQIGGIKLNSIPGEITYGLERLAMCIQNVDDIGKIRWNSATGDKKLTYADVDFEAERQFSKFNVELANVEMLKRHFIDNEVQCKFLIDNNLPIPAYDYCISASHIFNLLDSRGTISVTDRVTYIGRVRHLAKICCEKWIELEEKNHE